VTIPNRGQLPTDGTEDVGGTSTGSDRADDDVKGSMVARDDGAHSAKGAKFELPASAPSVRSQRGLDQARERPGAGTAPVSEPPAQVDAVSSRVESVPHTVERDENFWTISRLYYSSGRYYRALWKANADKHPDIRVLHVGDVIVVPPVEDLDPAYFVAPRADTGSTPARAQAGLARPRRADDSTGSIALPSLSSAVHSVSRRDVVGRRDETPLTGNDQDSAEPETPSAPNSQNRSGDAAAASRLLYKVRPYDTLRSIARDKLGDARRADEILELNHELIDDPAHLTTGQLLKLPDDARTGR
jgi:nucleoid-associated protein YgaU